MVLIQQVQDLGWVDDDIQAHHVHNGVRAKLSCLLEEREDLINGTLVPVSDTTTEAVLWEWSETGEDDLVE